MTQENLNKLVEFGQSIWFDDINREAIDTGKLADLVANYHVTGGTSNPTIFEKAFSGTEAYAEQFRDLAGRLTDPAKIQDQLAITDVQMAADLFRDAYERTKGADGYASLEVSPVYADNTEATIAETRRLFAALDRPNVMIKIPGTQAGIPAIFTCLSEGINVNITLLFSVENYGQVLEAFVSAMEKRYAMGEPIESIASVASFFVSRVDTMADERLAGLADKADDDAAREGILAMQGKLGIANAKLAYQRFEEMTASDRWARLANAGARVQRCLWASTSTKNPKYPDTLYVDSLLGTQTVNTLPEDTLYAFADHGTPALTLGEGVPEAKRLMRSLADAGLDVKAVVEDLQREGVEKFDKSYQDALAAIAERSRRLGVR